MQYRLNFRALLLKIKICQNKKAIKFVATNHQNK
jgi:hypothetical protein